MRKPATRSCAGSMSGFAVRLLRIGITSTWRHGLYPKPVVSADAKRFKRKGRQSPAACIGPAMRTRRTMTAIEHRIARLERQLALTNEYLVSGLWSALDAAHGFSIHTRPISCIVCGHTDRRSGFEVKTDRCMFGGGELERYVCPSCDCIFGPLKYLDLDEVFVDLDYRMLYSGYQESDSSNNETRTFRSLLPQHYGPYLNWGCGGAWSPTVATLRTEGWDVWGYEPSAETSGEFIAHSRDAISARFLGIFSNNVIEHFRKPIEQFREFHERLLPDGKMAHSSPC